MAQHIRQPKNDEAVIGGVSIGLHMDTCSVCGAPVTLLGDRPDVVVCGSCPAPAPESSQD